LPEKDVLKYSLTKNPHLQVPLGLFEPRLSVKSGEAFKEIEDAEGILRSVNNLVDSIKFTAQHRPLLPLLEALFLDAKHLLLAVLCRQQNSRIREHCFPKVAE